MQEPLFPDSDASRLEYALTFVKTKIAQRLINPKKTDQIAVVLSGGRTRNQLETDGKEGYEHIEEFMDMRQPTFADLAKLDVLKPGKHAVDLIAAIYVAGDVLRRTKVRRKDSQRNVVLLTDADEPGFTDDDGQFAVNTSWEDENWVQALREAVIPGLDGTAIDLANHFKLGIMYVYMVTRDCLHTDVKAAEWILVDQTTTLQTRAAGRKPR